MASEVEPPANEQPTLASEEPALDMSMFDWFADAPQRPTPVAGDARYTLPEHREVGYAVEHSVRGYVFLTFLQNCTPAELNDLDNSCLMRLEDFNLMESYAGSGIGIEIYPDIAISLYYDFNIASCLCCEL